MNEINGMDRVEEFLAFLAGEHAVSANSMAAYRSDLKNLLVYTEKRNVHFPEGMDASFFRVYFEEMKEQGTSSATMARRLSSVKKFWKYLSRTGAVLSTSCIEDLTIPTETDESRENREVLTLQEVTDLLSAPDISKWNGVRDRAILELMYSTGIRAGELVRIRIQDINLQINYLDVLQDDGEVRSVPFGDRARRAVQAYIRSTQEYFSGRGDYLFLNRDKTGMSRQSIWKLTVKYGTAAGIKSRVTPNLIRATLAYQLLASGGDPDSVQEMLGLSSTESIRKYFPDSGQESRQEYRRTQKLG